MKKPCLRCGIPTDDSTCPPCLEAHPPKKRSTTPKAPTAQRGYDHEWRKVARAVLVRDRWRCHICGKQLIKGDATVDHLIPLAVAPHLRLDMGNLAAACRSCNSRKGART